MSTAEPPSPPQQLQPPAPAAAVVDPNIKRLVLVTDAWDPQINGVVRTLKTTASYLRSMGVEVHLITPQDFNTVPCPTYPSIKLAVLPGEKVRRRITELAPHALHIATEGSLGWAARNYAVELGIPFTTAYHTRFPEYVQKRLFLPVRVTYCYLNWFHRFSRSIMVPTPMMKSILDEHAFPNVKLWSRGVDLSVFQMPSGKTPPRLKRGQPGWPIYLYAGRVAVEKNVEAFLALDLPGQKWVVGDGPALEGLKEQYPNARYFGFLNQTELAKVYQQASVFVFPSKTDTFGLVLLEAMATGLPVAAYPVSGPIDVVSDSGAGVLDEDLRAACLKALDISPAAARAHAEQYSWEAATNMFRSHLAFIPPQQLAEGVRAWSAARFLGTEDDASNDLVPYLPAELQALLQPPAAATAAGCDGRLCPFPPVPYLAAAGANATATTPLPAADAVTATAAGVLSLPRAHYLGDAARAKASLLTTYLAFGQALAWGCVEQLLLTLGKRAPGSAWTTVLLVLAGLLVMFGPTKHKQNQRRALGVTKKHQQWRHRQATGAGAGAESRGREHGPVLRTPPMSPASTASVSRSPSSLSSRGGWDSE